MRRCSSYKINSDCHLDQDDDDCLVPSNSMQAIGVNLGECTFSAKPQGDLSDKGWALFRRGAAPPPLPLRHSPCVCKEQVQKH